jgi:hypothetical protein
VVVDGLAVEEAGAAGAAGSLPVVFDAPSAGATGALAVERALDPSDDSLAARLSVL